MNSLIHHARKAPCVLTLFCQPPTSLLPPPNLNIMKLNSNKKDVKITAMIVISHTLFSLIIILVSMIMWNWIIYELHVERKI
jgi:hypothetical protein